MLAELLLVASPLSSLAPSPTPIEPPAFANALSDRALAQISGGASGGGVLRRLADGQARDEFRVSGAIATTQMDVWWSSTGASMIAENVRGTL